MINACFFKNARGLSGFEISGHSGFAARGNDIVCASVSSAVQMTANTITECIGDKAGVSESGNTISLKLQPSSSDASRAILAGLKLHLTLLSQDYKGTIKISITEV